MERIELIIDNDGVQSTVGATVVYTRAELEQLFREWQKEDARAAHYENEQWLREEAEECPRVDAAPWKGEFGGTRRVVPRRRSNG